MIDEGRRVLAAQPFSVLMGAELKALGSPDGKGLAVIEIPIRPDLLQQHGYVHGGVLSYLADNAMAFAAGSVLGPNVLSAGHEITYLKPATGDRVYANAWVDEVEGLRATCRCVIVAVTDGNMVECATGAGTVVLSS